MEKQRVLILGGCGFIGRNFVSYLVENNLVAAIRVVDKVPPQIAWLNENCQKAFQSPIVEFKSANLINFESCKNAFASSAPWDYVINCAGETKLGQNDAVYEEGILKLSENCAKLAAQAHATHYVELTSGKMYSSEKHAHKEDGRIEPWTLIAKWENQVEKRIAEIAGLNWTVLRLATVYGIGDRAGLMPRIMAAAIYRYLGETMKMMWNGDLRVNTVHVEDVARAIWFVCQREDTVKQVYNVVDDANSTQGTISALLGELFDVKIDFVGNILSNVVDLKSIVEDANDKHLVPWAEMCSLDKTQNTPLTPHMDPELLLHKHLHLDGAKLKNLGFKLTVAGPSIERLEEIVRDFVKSGLFPYTLAP